MDDAQPVPRIGIDLGGTKIEGIVLAPDGAISIRERIASPSDSYSDVVAAVSDLAERLIRRAGLSAATPIGIGTPGVWQPAVQAMKNCNSTVLNGKPLLIDLERRLGRPVRLANDANCFALSESTDGAGAGEKTVFGVILGTGVGGGIVVNGEALNGPNAIAGEWGHTPIAYLRHEAHAKSQAQTDFRGEALGAARTLADRVCYCGRVNCTESFLSGPGLARTATELLGRTYSAVDVFSDPEAESIAELYIEMLAASLAQVMNVLDPDVVVLGGGLSAQPELYRRLPKVLPHYLFSPECRTPVVPPVHGDSSGVRGAAWLWSGYYRQSDRERDRKEDSETAS